MAAEGALDCPSGTEVQVCTAARKPRPMFDLVIFDCDGVLVDSEPLAAQLLSEALQPFGLAWSAAEVDVAFRGMRMADCLERIESELGHVLPPDFERSLARRERECFAESLKPIPGVADVLKHLKDVLDVPVCVASSSGPDRIEHSLRVTGLFEFFPEARFSGIEVENGKPAPDLFIYSAHRCGAAPLRCAVIEDSVAGITGGLAAGMQVFAYRAKPEPAHSQRVDFDRMGALTDLFVASAP